MSFKNELKNSKGDLDKIVQLTLNEFAKLCEKINAKKFIIDINPDGSLSSSNTWSPNTIEDLNSQVYKFVQVLSKRSDEKSEKKLTACFNFLEATKKYAYITLNRKEYYDNARLAQSNKDSLEKLRAALKVLEQKKAKANLKKNNLIEIEDFPDIEIDEKTQQEISDSINKQIEERISDKEFEDTLISVFAKDSSMKSIIEAQNQIKKELYEKDDDDWRNDDIPYDTWGDDTSIHGYLELTRTQKEWEEMLRLSSKGMDWVRKHKKDPYQSFQSVYNAIAYANYNKNEPEYKKGKEEAAQRGMSLLQDLLYERNAERKKAIQIVNTKVEKEYEAKKREIGVSTAKGIKAIPVDMGEDIIRSVKEKTAQRISKRIGYFSGGYTQRLKGDDLFDYYKPKGLPATPLASKEVSNGKKIKIKVKIPVEIKPTLYYRDIFQRVKLEKDLKKNLELQAYLIAKLFQELVSNTPMDEDYNSTSYRIVIRKERIKMYKTVLEELSSSKKDKNNKVKVKVLMDAEEAAANVKVRAEKVEATRKHKADEHSVRGDWTIDFKGTVYKAFETEPEGNETRDYDFCFSKEDFETKGSKRAITKIAKAFIKNADPKIKSFSFNPINLNPRWEMLEFGYYKTDSGITGKGKYVHGTKNKHSYQAPYGFMRITKMNFERIVNENGIMDYIKDDYKLDVSKNSKQIREILKEHPELKQRKFGKCLVKIKR